MREVSVLARPAGSPGSHTSTAREMYSSCSDLGVQMRTHWWEGTLRSVQGKHSGQLLLRSETCNSAPSTLSCCLSGIDIAVQGVLRWTINLSLPLTWSNKLPMLMGWVGRLAPQSGTSRCPSGGGLREWIIAPGPWSLLGNCARGIMAYVCRAQEGRRA